MDIPMDAEVFCTDGFCGRSTRVVLKPKTEEVTHLVVKEKESPHKELLIPVTVVTATTPDSINLSLTRGKLAQLQPFIETEYVKVNIPRYAGGVYSLAGDFYSEPEVLPARHELTPAGELAVRQGARVEATDGRVGRVDEFIVDPVTERVTHLVMRQGHLWGKRDVAIPVSAIDHLEENTIYLKLDKDRVGALPSSSGGLP